MVVKHGLILFLAVVSSEFTRVAARSKPTSQHGSSVFSFVGVPSTSSSSSGGGSTNFQRRHSFEEDHDIYGSRANLFRVTKRQELGGGDHIITYKKRFLPGPDGNLPVNIDFEQNQPSSFIKTYRKVVRQGQESLFEIPTDDNFRRVLSAKEYRDGTFVAIVRRKMTVLPDGTEENADYSESLDSRSVLRTNVRILLPSGIERKFQIPSTRRVDIVNSTLETDGTVVVVYQKRTRKGTDGVSDVDVDIEDKSRGTFLRTYEVRIRRDLKAELREINIPDEYEEVEQRYTVESFKGLVGLYDTPRQRLIANYTEYDGTKVAIIRLRIKTSLDGDEVEVDYDDVSPQTSIITIIRRVRPDRNIVIIKIYNFEAFNRRFSGRRKLLGVYTEQDNTRVYIYRQRLRKQPDGTEVELDYEDDGPSSNSIVITILRKVRPDGREIIQKVYENDMKVSTTKAPVPAEVIQTVYYVTYRRDQLVDHNPRHKLIVNHLRPDGTWVIVYVIRVRKRPDGSEVEVEPNDKSPDTYTVIVEKEVRPDGKVVEERTHPTTSRVPKTPKPSIDVTITYPDPSRPLGEKEKIVNSTVEPDGTIVTVYVYKYIPYPGGYVKQIPYDRNDPRGETVTIWRYVYPDGTVKDSVVEKGEPSSSTKPAIHVEEFEEPGTTSTRRPQVEQPRPATKRPSTGQIYVEEFEEPGISPTRRPQVEQPRPSTKRPSTGQIYVEEFEERDTTSTQRPQVEQPRPATTESPLDGRVVIPLYTTGRPTSLELPKCEPVYLERETVREIDPAAFLDVTKYTLTSTTTNPNGDVVKKYEALMQILPNGQEVVVENPNGPNTYRIFVERRRHPDGRFTITEYRRLVSPKPALTRPDVYYSVVQTDDTQTPTPNMPSVSIETATFDPSDYVVINRTTDANGIITIYYQTAIQVGPDGKEKPVSTDKRLPGTYLITVIQTIKPKGPNIVKQIVQYVGQQPSAPTVAPFDNDKGIPPEVFDPKGYELTNQTINRDGSIVSIYERYIQKLPNGDDVVVQSPDGPNTRHVIVEVRISPDGPISIIERHRFIQPKRTTPNKPNRLTVTHQVIEENEDPQATSNGPSPNDLLSVFDFSGYKPVNKTADPDGTTTTTYIKVIQVGPDGRERIVHEHERSPGTIRIIVKKRVTPDGHVSITETRRHLHPNPSSHTTPGLQTYTHQVIEEDEIITESRSSPSPNKQQPEFDTTGYKLVGSRNNPDGSTTTTYHRVVRPGPDGKERPADSEETSPGTIRITVTKTVRPNGDTSIIEKRTHLQPDPRSPSRPNTPNYTHQVIEEDEVVPGKPGSPSSQPEQPEFDTTGYKVVGSRSNPDGSRTTTYRRVVRPGPDGKDRPVDDYDKSPGNIVVIVTKRVKPNGDISVIEQRTRLQPRPDSPTKPNGPSYTHQVIEIDEDVPESSDAPTRKPQQPEFDPAGYKVVGHRNNPDGSTTTTYKKVVRPGPDGKDYPVDDSDRSPGNIVVIVTKRVKPNGDTSVVEQRTHLQPQPTSPLKPNGPAYTHQVIEEDEVVPGKPGSPSRQPERPEFDTTGYKLVGSRNNPDGSTTTTYHRVVRPGPDGKERPVDSEETSPGTIRITVTKTVRPNGDTSIIEKRTHLQPDPRSPSRPNTPNYTHQVIEEDEVVPGKPGSPSSQPEQPEFDTTGYKVVGSRSNPDGSRTTTYRRVVRPGPDGKDRPVDDYDKSPGNIVVIVTKRVKPNGDISVIEQRTRLQPRPDSPTKPNGPSYTHQVIEIDEDVPESSDAPSRKPQQPEFDPAGYKVVGHRNNPDGSTTTTYKKVVRPGPDGKDYPVDDSDRSPGNIVVIVTKRVKPNGDTSVVEQRTHLQPQPTSPLKPNGPAYTHQVIEEDEIVPGKPGSPSRQPERPEFDTTGYKLVGSRNNPDGSTTTTYHRVVRPGPDGKERPVDSEETSPGTIRITVTKTVRPNGDTSIIEKRTHLQPDPRSPSRPNTPNYTHQVIEEDEVVPGKPGSPSSQPEQPEFDTTGYKVVGSRSNPDGSTTTTYHRVVRPGPDGKERPVDPDETSPGTIRITVTKTVRPNGDTSIIEKRTHLQPDPRSPSRPNAPNYTHQVIEEDEVVPGKPGSPSRQPERPEFDTTGYKLVGSRNNPDGSTTTTYHRVVRPGPDGKERPVDSEETSPGTIRITVTKTVRPNGDTSIIEKRTHLQPDPRSPSRPNTPNYTHQVIEEDEVVPGKPGSPSSQPEQPEFDTTGYKVVGSRSNPDGSRTTTYRRVVRPGPDGKDRPVDDYDKSPGNIVVIVTKRVKPNGDISVIEQRTRLQPRPDSPTKPNGPSYTHQVIEIDEDVPESSDAPTRKPQQPEFDPAGYKVVGHRNNPDGSTTTTYKKVVRPGPDGKDYPVDDSDRSPGNIVVIVTKRVKPNGDTSVVEQRTHLQPQPTSPLKPNGPAYTHQVIEEDEVVPGKPGSPSRQPERPEFDTTGYKLVGSRNNPDGSTTTTYHRVVRPGPDGKERPVDSEETSPGTIRITVTKTVRPNGDTSIIEKRTHLQPDPRSPSRPNTPNYTHQVIEEDEVVPGKPGSPSSQPEQPEFDTTGYKVVGSRSNPDGSRTTTYRRVVRPGPDGKDRPVDDYDKSPGNIVVIVTKRVKPNGDISVIEQRTRLQPRPDSPTKPNGPSYTHQVIEIDEDVPESSDAPTRKPQQPEFDPAGYKVVGHRNNPDGSTTTTYKKVVRPGPDGKDYPVDDSDRSPGNIVVIVTKRVKPNGDTSVVEQRTHLQPQPTSPLKPNGPAYTHQVIEEDEIVPGKPGSPSRQPERPEFDTTGYKLVGSRNNPDGSTTTTYHRVVRPGPDGKERPVDSEETSPGTIRITVTKTVRPNGDTSIIEKRTHLQPDPRSPSRPNTPNYTHQVIEEDEVVPGKPGSPSSQPEQPEFDTTGYKVVGSRSNPDGSRTTTYRRVVRPGPDGKDRPVDDYDKSPGNIVVIVTKRVKPNGDISVIEQRTRLQPRPDSPTKPNGPSYTHQVIEIDEDVPESSDAPSRKPQQPEFDPAGYKVVGHRNNPDGSTTTTYKKVVRPGPDGKDYPVDDSDRSPGNIVVIVTKRVKPNGDTSVVEQRTHLQPQPTSPLKPNGPAYTHQVIKEDEIVPGKPGSASRQPERPEFDTTGYKLVGSRNNPDGSTTTTYHRVVRPGPDGKERPVDSEETSPGTIRITVTKTVRPNGDTSIIEKRTHLQPDPRSPSRPNTPNYTHQVIEEDEVVPGKPGSPSSQPEQPEFDTTGYKVVGSRSNPDGSTTTTYHRVVRPGPDGKERPVDPDETSPGTIRITVTKTVRPNGDTSIIEKRTHLQPDPRSPSRPNAPNYTHQVIEEDEVVPGKPGSPSRQPERPEFDTTGYKLVGSRNNPDGSTTTTYHRVVRPGPDGKERPVDSEETSPGTIRITVTKTVRPNGDTSIIEKRTHLQPDPRSPSRPNTPNYTHQVIEEDEVVPGKPGSPSSQPEQPEFDTTGYKVVGSRSNPDGSRTTTYRRVVRPGPDGKDRPVDDYDKSPGNIVVIVTKRVKPNGDISVIQQRTRLQPRPDSPTKPNGPSYTHQVIEIDEDVPESSDAPSRKPQQPEFDPAGYKVVGHRNNPDGSTTTTYKKVVRPGPDGKDYPVDDSDRSPGNIVVIVTKRVKPNGDTSVVEQRTHLQPQPTSPLKPNGPAYTHQVIEEDEIVPGKPGSPSRQPERPEFDTTGYKLVGSRNNPDGSTTTTYHRYVRPGPDGKERPIDSDETSPGTIRITVTKIVRPNGDTSIIEKRTHLQPDPRSPSRPNTPNYTHQVIEEDEVVPGKPGSPSSQPEQPEFDTTGYKVVGSRNNPDGSTTTTYHRYVRPGPDGKERPIDSDETSPGTIRITVTKTVRPNGDTSIIEKRTNLQPDPRSPSRPNTPNYTHQVIEEDEVVPGKPGSPSSQPEQPEFDTTGYKVVGSRSNPDGSTTTTYHRVVRPGPDGKERPVDPDETSPGTIRITVTKTVRPNGDTSIIEKRTHLQPDPRSPSRPNAPNYTHQVIEEDEVVPGKPGSPSRQPEQPEFDTTGYKLVGSRNNPDGSTTTTYHRYVRPGPDGKERPIDSDETSPGTIRITVTKTVRPNGDTSIIEKRTNLQPDPRSPSRPNTPNYTHQVIEEDEVVPGKPGSPIRQPEQPEFDTTGYKLVGSRNNPDGSTTTTYHRYVRPGPDGKERPIDSDETSPGTIRITVTKTVRPNGDTSIIEKRTNLQPDPRSPSRPNTPNYTHQVIEEDEVVPGKPGSPSRQPEQPEFDTTGYKLVGSRNNPDGSTTTTYHRVVRTRPDGKERPVDSDETSPGTIRITVTKTVRPNGDTSIIEKRTHLQPDPRSPSRPNTPNYTHQVIEEDEVVPGKPGSPSRQPEQPEFDTTGYKLVGSRNNPDGSTTTTYHRVVRPGRDGKERPVDPDETSPGTIRITVTKTVRPNGDTSIIEKRTHLQPDPRSPSRPNTPNYTHQVIEEDEDVEQVAPSTSNGFTGLPAIDAGYKRLNSSTGPDGVKTTIYQKFVQVGPDGKERVVDVNERSPGTIRVTLIQCIKPDGSVNILEKRVVLKEAGPFGNVQWIVNRYPGSVIEDTRREGYDSYIVVLRVQIPGSSVSEYRKVRVTNGKLVEELPVEDDIYFVHAKAQEDQGKLATIEKDPSYKLVDTYVDAYGTKVYVYKKKIKIVSNGKDVDADYNDESPGSYTIKTVIKRERKDGSFSFSTSSYEVRQVIPRSPVSLASTTSSVWKVLNWGSQFDQVSARLDRLLRQFSGYKVEEMTTKQDGALIVIISSNLRTAFSSKVIRRKFKVLLDGTAVELPIEESCAQSQSKVEQHEVEWDRSYKLTETKVEKDGTYVYIFKKKFRRDGGGREVNMDYSESSSPGILVKTVIKRRRLDGSITYSESVEELKQKSNSFNVWDIFDQDSGWDTRVKEAHHHPSFRQGLVNRPIFG